MSYLLTIFPHTVWRNYPQLLSHISKNKSKISLQIARKTKSKVTAGGSVCGCVRSFFTGSRSFYCVSEKVNSEEEAGDFFGINEYEAGKKSSGNDAKDLGDTHCSKLNESKSDTSDSEAWMKKRMLRGKRRESQGDSVLRTSFGLVRIDGRIKTSNNKENSTVGKGSDFSKGDLNSGSDFINDQYFNYEQSNDSNVGRVDTSPQLDETSKVQSKYDDSSFNFVDEQYFRKTPSLIEINEDENTLSQKGPPIEVPDDLNYFDAQMFAGVKLEVEKEKPAVYSVTEDMKSHLNEDATRKNLKGPRIAEHQTKEYEFHEPVTKRETRSKRIPEANTEKPKTAYDMAMKMRLESKNLGEKVVGDVDSKGFRILKNQVPDFSHLNEALMVKLLQDSIIYDDNDIVAIDKPYGIPSQGGPGVHHSIASLLPKLAKKIDNTLKTLHPIHRLDKETTGVMVFAKTEEMKLKLTRLFKDREIIKKYWVITKGVPEPPTGVIEIPMAETTVNGVYRMTLKPDYNEKTRMVMKKSSVNTYQAITKYQVLDSNNGAALVQCEPATGVKHQIRCHLSFGLNTPILGDHKYSHFTRIAPQRLYPATLQRLGIRQSKVRHVPMHLHAKSIIIPGILEGRYLHLSTRLPKHFAKNMKTLRLSPPN